MCIGKEVLFMSQKNISEEKLAQVDQIIAEHKDQPGALIPVLHKSQELFGYLPEEVQKRVAEGLNVPLSEVYGVITFYSLFNLQPEGEHVINLCMGTACYVKGATLIQEEIEKQLHISVNETTDDGKFTLKFSRCVGACSLAPFMMVDEDVYGRVKAKDIKFILAKYY